LRAGRAGLAGRARGTGNRRLTGVRDRDARPDEQRSPAILLVAPGLRRDGESAVGGHGPASVAVDLHKRRLPCAARDVVPARAQLVTAERALRAEDLQEAAATGVDGVGRAREHNVDPARGVEAQRRAGDRDVAVRDRRRRCARNEYQRNSRKNPRLQVATTGTDDAHQGSRRR
jgi:hypothetical protein